MYYRPIVLNRILQRALTLFQKSPLVLNDFVLYTVSQKIRHQTLAHNFTKYQPIFKILPLLDSVGNL